MAHSTTRFPSSELNFGTATLIDIAHLRQIPDAISGWNCVLTSTTKLWLHAVSTVEFSAKEQHKMIQTLEPSWRRFEENEILDTINIARVNAGADGLRAAGDAHRIPGPPC